MADQSVIDIRFKDVLARDLKAVLGKTLDELVKDLVKSSEDALGVSGSMTNLGIIPKRDGTIGGVRFAVDSARLDDFKTALRNRLGAYAERAGVGQVASVLNNAQAKAFKESYIKLPDNDPAFAKEVLDFIDNSGGKIIWSGHNEEKAYMNLRVRLPQAHLRGDNLSVAQRFNAYRAESDSTILVREEKLRAAARAEASRKKDTGYVSEADLVEQEERRKRLGIVTDESGTVEQAEKTAYFSKSLIYFATIAETVRRIFSVVSKLYDNALKTSYTAQAANVNPDQLRQLEYALQGFGFDKGVAGTTLGLISGGLMNPLQLNESLVDTLAPMMGKDTADMVNDMLMGGGDSLSALTTIMEAARRKVAAGGMTGTNDAGKAFSEVYSQLKTAGGGLEQMFQAYMKATDKANAQGWKTFGFSDFLNLFPATGTELSADAALQKYFLGAKVKSGAENTVYGATYDPSKPFRNFRWTGNPFVKEEDFLKALNKYGFDVSGDSDVFSFENGVKDLKSKATSKEEREELQRLLDTFTDMRAKQWQSNEPYWSTDGYKLPFSFVSEDAFIGPALERAAQGYTGLPGSGGMNYYETDNSVHTTTQSESGVAQVDMNLRINGKDVGSYPIEIGSDNFIISGEILGV